MVVAITLAIAFAPVRAFYFVYRRYSVFLPEYESHAIHFILGACAAAVLSLGGAWIPRIPGAWSSAFFNAALPERTIVFLILWFSPLIRSSSRPISEKIAAGILTGLGFARIPLQLVAALRRAPETAFLVLRI